MLIATHNGGFHADDVLGVAMIRLQHAASVVRTRDPAVIATADFVVDVGGQHDPQQGRFDHHQKGGAGVRESGVPYASAGLVWQALGKGIVARLTGLPEDAAEVAEVAARVDAGLISTVDAVDCGVEGFYKGPASVSALIGSFNPDWRAVHPDFDSAFAKAVAFATTILENAVRDAHAAAAARSLVASAIRHADGKVVELTKSCPWQEHLAVLHPEAIFLVFPDESGRWRVRDVPVAPGTFTAKKRLPKAWGGLEGKALDAVTGLQNCVFCHTGLFVAGHQDRAGALAMAMLALEAD